MRNPLISWLVYLAVALVTALIAPVAVAQNRYATMELTNRTNATLHFEFEHDVDYGETAEVTIPPGERRTIRVPSGIVIMFVDAPYSSSDASFEGTDILNTHETYSVVMTPRAMGVASLHDDRRSGGGQGGLPAVTPERIYSDCGRMSGGDVRWVLYNPANTMSRTEYHEVGDILCSDDGTSVYSRGATMRHYHCTGSHSGCQRDEGWDGTWEGNETDYETTLDGRTLRATERDFRWTVSTAIDWRMARLQ